MRRPFLEPEGDACSATCTIGILDEGDHDFTLDDPDHGVEYWKMRAIRAEAQTDMYKDELRVVRAEADALLQPSSVVEMSPIALAQKIIPSTFPGPVIEARKNGRETARRVHQEKAGGAFRCGDGRERGGAGQRDPLNRPVQPGDESWAANLTPGEMILLGNKIRKMLRDTGKATVDRDGWFGPVGAGGNGGDVLFHNVRWWSRPRGGDSFRIKWDRSLDDHRKTVLFYKSGYVQVLDEDVAMQQMETRAPTNDRENQFLIIARPIPGPRSKLAFNSTYRGRDPGPSDPGPSGGQGGNGGGKCGKRGTSKDRGRRSTLGPHGYVRYADINKRGRSSGPAQTRYNGERAVKPPSPPKATRLRCLSPQNSSIKMP